MRRIFISFETHVVIVRYWIQAFDSPLCICIVRRTQTVKKKLNFLSKHNWKIVEPFVLLYKSVTILQTAPNEIPSRTQQKENQ